MAGIEISHSHQAEFILQKPHNIHLSQCGAFALSRFSTYNQLIILLSKLHFLALIEAKLRKVKSLNYIGLRKIRDNWANQLGPIIRAA